MTNPQQNALAEALEPCPWCSGEAIYCFNKHVGRPEMHWYLCRTCYASPGERATQAEAITAWNRRTSNNPAAVEGQGDLTVIDPDAWEPCSPAYLAAGGSCHAPRVWNEATKNHWHPKLPVGLAPEPIRQGEAVEAMIFDCDFPSQSARFLMDDGFMVAGGIYEIRRVRTATADDKAKYATRKDPPEYADEAAPNADREGV